MSESRTPAQRVASVARFVNRPVVTLLAVAVALVLGATQLPAVQYLRPVGEFYIAILQMCVLPFLLVTIPLSVRSAMQSEAMPGRLLGSLLVWLAVTLLVVAAIGVLVPTAVSHIATVDSKTMARIGALVGSSQNRVELEFALDPTRAVASPNARETGLVALVPTNVFAALASNDSMRVLVFSAIFGIGMVLSERRSGHSVFRALRHIQEVCAIIFEWFNILVPVGIVALIAPQIALIGTETYAALALFTYAFLAATGIILVGSIIVLSARLRLRVPAVLGCLLGPMMMGAATRNTLVCIPAALETMTERLGVQRQPCELYIPLGFSTVRFGTILYFATAAVFMGTLVGRTFDLAELALVAALAVGASFATLGVTGLAAMAPLAAVLAPFGLSYELAVPLLIIVDPIANMLRVMINIAVNCLIPALAAGNGLPLTSSAGLPPSG